MIVKVCGIKTVENLAFLKALDVDMVGLNFYKPSVRYIHSDIKPQIFDTLPDKVERVGVFVNEDLETVVEKAHTFRLDFIQLHGDESIEYCAQLSEHFPIIKVFRIGEDFDFSMIDNYSMATYFLLDTHTPKFGGSGKKFNWDILNHFQSSRPFLLSGGIGPNDMEQLKLINNPQFIGVDINSKFESAPGVKDEHLVTSFIKSLKVR